MNRVLRLLNAAVWSCLISAITLVLTRDPWVSFIYFAVCSLFFGYNPGDEDDDDSFPPGATG